MSHYDTNSFTRPFYLLRVNSLSTTPPVRTVGRDGTSEWTTLFPSGNVYVKVVTGRGRTGGRVKGIRPAFGVRDVTPGTISPAKGSGLTRHRGRPGRNVVGRGR